MQDYTETYWMETCSRALLTSDWCNGSSPSRTTTMRWKEWLQDNSEGPGAAEPEARLESD